VLMGVGVGPRTDRIRDDGSCRGGLGSGGGGDMVVSCWLVV